MVIIVSRSRSYTGVADDSDTHAPGFVVEPISQLAAQQKELGVGSALAYTAPNHFLV